MKKLAKARAEEEMHDRWQTLPGDLHDKIIPFIPIPDLCRFRKVSKRWRYSIDKLAFAATIKSTATYLLIIPDRDEAEDRRTGNTARFRMRDTKSHKRYDISPDFLHRTPSHPHLNELDARRLALAADKGLICDLLQIVGLDEVIYVENPIRGTWSELPCFNRTSDHDYEMLNLCVVITVVDDMTHFRIFVLQEATPRDSQIPEKNRFSTFDSRVGEWHDLAQPPSRLLRQFHMLKVGKFLYTVFFNLQTPTRLLSPNEVYAYDIDQDVWSYTDVRVGGYYEIPQLMTFSCRLFLTAWEDHWEQKVTIWEIALANSMDERTWTFWEVTQWNGGDVAGLIPLYANSLGRRLHSHGDHLGSIGLNVLAVASGDGRIVFTSVTGECVAYRVVTNKWDYVRRGWTFGFDMELEAGLGKREGVGRRLRSCMVAENRAGLFGCVMKLTLCAVPVVAKPANVL